MSSEELLEETTDRTDYVKALLSKLRSKMKSPIHDLDKAKVVRRFFVELRNVLSMDNKDMRIARVVFCDHICEFIISKHETVLSYGIILDAFFRCIVPILRSAQYRQLLSKQLLYGDGIPFTMAVLRKYHSDPNITIQGIEIVAALVEFIAGMESYSSARDKSRGVGRPPQLSSGSGDVGAGRKKVDGRSKSADEFIHQVIMHGGSSVIPGLLCRYTELRNELCVRRLSFCLHFLLGHSQANFAIRVATYDNWTPLRSLCAVLKWSTLDVALAAAAVLLGLLTSSPIVTDQCIYMGGLSGLASVMLDVSDLDVPGEWLRGSLMQVQSYTQRMAMSMSDQDEDDIANFSLAVERLLDRRSTVQEVVAGPAPGAAGSRAVLGGGAVDETDAVLQSASRLVSALEQQPAAGFWPELPAEDPHHFDGSVLDRLKSGPLVDHAGPDYDTEQLNPPPPKKEKRDKKKPKKKQLGTKKPFVGEFNPKNTAAAGIVAGAGQPSSSTLSEADAALTQTNALNNIAETLFATAATKREGEAAALNEQEGEGESGLEGGDKGAGGQPSSQESTSAPFNPDSAVAKLNYAERLQVMILQVQSMNESE